MNCEQLNVFEKFRNYHTSILEAHRKNNETQQNIYQHLTQNEGFSIINIIFSQYRLYSNQPGNSRFDISSSLFEKWKQEKFGNDFELGHQTFRDIYKKLYEFPSLHKLASRGFIHAEHIKQWSKIEPKLSSNLDEVVSADYLTNLLKQQREDDDEEKEEKEPFIDVGNTGGDENEEEEGNEREEGEEEDGEGDGSMTEVEDEEERDSEIEENIEKEGDEEEDKIADKKNMNVGKRKRSKLNEKGTTTPQSQKNKKTRKSKSNIRVTTRKEMTVSINKRFGEDIHEVKLNQDFSMTHIIELWKKNNAQCIFNTDGRMTKKLTTLDICIKRMVNKMKENTNVKHIIPQDIEINELNSSTSLGASILQISESAPVGKWHQDSENGEGYFLLLNLSKSEYTFEYYSFHPNPSDNLKEYPNAFKREIKLNQNEGILCPHQIIHRGNQVKETTYLLHLNFIDIPKNNHVRIFD